MKKTLWNSDWYCMVCHKPLKNEFTEDAKDSNTDAFPNIKGGTARIRFGYGSRHDQLGEWIANPHRNTEYIACICDDCFDDNRSLIKKVRSIETTKFNIID
jgi:hypothetical protein